MTLSRLGFSRVFKKTATMAPNRRRGGVTSNNCPFTLALPLKSHWPQQCYMPILSCKEGWESKYFSVSVSEVKVGLE